MTALISGVPTIGFPARGFTRALARITPDGWINPFHERQGARGEQRRLAMEEHLRCRFPRFLWICDFGRHIDVAETGIPLCTPSAAASLLVPRLKPEMLTLSPQSTASSDLAGFDFWRALTAVGIAQQSICFAISPFVLKDENVSVEPFEIAQHMIYLRQILRWYPNMAAIAVNRRASEALAMERIDHVVLGADRNPGESLQQILVRLVAESRSKVALIP